MVSCDLCGGKNFYKESGFYYCNECQTQTQEIQEHVFETEEVPGQYREAPKSKTTRLKRPTSKKDDDKITTWEYYNYVLLGLTKELINLGVDSSFKATVKYLWMRYLEKIQVISKSKDAIPKLQTINSCHDAEVLYGKPRKRKRHASSASRRTSTDDSDTSTMDKSSIKKSRGRKKQLLAKAQYEEFTQKTSASSHTHNETLTSLQTTPEGSVKSKKIKFNKYSKQELLKRFTRNHLKKHEEDQHNELTCHKTTLRYSTNIYTSSSTVLSINKIYSLLYLGLLISGESNKIGLSEILRFIREGNLSFNNYKHFFPEDDREKISHFMNIQKNQEFHSKSLRVAILNLAYFLKVDTCIPTPNLLMLCEKYCKELNLPDIILTYVKNLILTIQPKMYFKNATGSSPNYSARAMSIIIMVLKLLFGLDDVTEVHLSKYAELLNRSRQIYPKMFNFEQWLKYIDYRKLILSEHHFPTHFAHDKTFKKTDEFIQCLKDKEDDSDDERPLTQEEDNYKQILKKLASIQKPVRSLIEFPPSLTPSYDYTKVLLREGIAEQNDYIEDILNQDFENDCLDFLMKPNNYLSLLNKNNNNGTYEIKNGGANENIEIEDVLDSKYERFYYRYHNREEVLIKLQTLEAPDKNLESITSYKHVRSKKDSKNIVDNFKNCHEHKFFKNHLQNDSICEEFKLSINDLGDIFGEDEQYNVHYNPFECYWTRLHYNCESKKDFKKFFKKFPFNFQILIEECAQICEQSTSEFYDEFQLTEAYFIYLSKFRQKKYSGLDYNLDKLLKKAKTNW